MTVATEQDTVTFISKVSNQRLTIESAHNARRDEFGNEIVPAVPGVHVQFEQHVADVSEPRIIAALRNHRLFNQFSAHNGFWEENVAPDEPKPTPSERIGEVVAALKADDRKAVEAVLIAERGDHNRKVVLDAGEQALAALATEGTRADDQGIARPNPHTVPEALKAGAE